MTPDKFTVEVSVPSFELKPIDSAPKGVWILVLDEHHTSFWQACWSNEYNCFLWADGKMKIKRPAGWIPMPSIIKGAANDLPTAP